MGGSNVLQMRSFAFNVGQMKRDSQVIQRFQRAYFSKNMRGNKEARLIIPFYLTFYCFVFTYTDVTPNSTA